jgi:hypothetical protein
MMNKQQDLEDINYELQFQNNLFLKRIAELEKDAERLDWLLANPPKLQQTSQECFILAVPSNRKAVDDLRLLEALKESKNDD